MLLEVQGRVLEPLLRANRAQALPPARQSAEPLPQTGEVDVERLTRFAAFVEQLGRWFESQSGLPLSGVGKTSLGTVAGSLQRTAAVVEAMLARGGVAPVPPAAGPAIGDAPTLRPATTPPAGAEESVDVPRRPAADGPRLVLEDTERTPVLQTFKGAVELTFETREAIARFLAEAGIDYNSYQLDKLERKVLQWVQATPHGCVLVIKVGELRGRREAVPGYAKKS